MFKKSELDFHANAATMLNTPVLEQTQKVPQGKGQVADKKGWI